MRFGLGLFLLLALLNPAWGCQPGEDCTAGAGAYRVAPPPNWDGHSPLPTMIYFPGYKTTAADTMADIDIHGTAQRLGVLLVALEPAGGRWDLPPFGPPRRDEAAYVAAVLDAVEHDYPVDHSQLLAAGFSIGASMLWYLACSPPPSLSGRFTAFAAMSGTFWLPQPQTCAGPPFSLIQLNGTADKVFPIHGRSIQNGHMRQGDSIEAVDMLRRHDSCPMAAHRQDRMSTLGSADTSRLGSAKTPTPSGDTMPCDVDEACASGTRVRMCIHSGQHEVEGFWIDTAWIFTRQIAASRQREMSQGLRLQNHGG